MNRFTFLRSVRVWIVLLVCLLLLLSVTVGFFIYRIYLSGNRLESTSSADLIDYDDQICHNPKLDINNPEILQYLKDHDPLKCSDEEDWVEVEGSTAKITENARKKYGDIECKFVSVLRSNDYVTFLGAETTTRTEYVLEESDFFRVYCQAESGEKYLPLPPTNTKDAIGWENRMSGIRLDKDIFGRIGWEYVPNNGLKLNVLMFGFDSLSKLMFMRKLPKTYDKLKSLNAIVLEGHNIVGDGTLNTFVPMLTGKTVSELPVTLKDIDSESSYVNVYPFVWNDFRKFGYVTAYMEDFHPFGTFTWSAKGFNTQPVDHYMQTWYVDATEDFDNHEDFCIGSLTRHKNMMDYAKHVYRVYPNKPKFVFGFHGELSHDYINLIGVVDDDVVEWIEWFEKGGYLNDTLLIVMTDHGNRFKAVRNTQQGKLEERLPFFSFTFPTWFKYKYPQAYDNFQENAQRLTTPFDIYETLKNVLHFEGAGQGVLDKRAISLFKKIPKQRTCRDAGIEPHYCACLLWQAIDFNLSIIQRVAKEFVKFLNSYISQYTDMCEELGLHSIRQAAKLVPNKQILTYTQAFHNPYDLDSVFANAEGDFKAEITSEVYQVKLITEPGNALFEFSSHYHKNNDQFIFHINDVSRINAYGNDSFCISDKHARLHRFCYCKKQ